MGDTYLISRVEQTSAITLRLETSYKLSVIQVRPSIKRIAHNTTARNVIVDD